MTDLGDRATLRATAPAQPPHHEIPMWVLWTAFGLLVAGVAAVSTALFLELRSGDDEPHYPASWDPRVLPYVKVVEKQRGLTFEHPVAVRFQDPAEFEKGLRADDSKLTAKDKAEIRRTTGMLRALGLLHGDVDLFAAFNDTHTSGTLAYYSFADQRITVRGKNLVLASHATLVHELTHALQDQRFGVGKRMVELAKDDHPDDAVADVLDAVVEGDAERTAQLYRDSLRPAQRKRLVAAERAFEKPLLAKVSKVPKVVVAYMSAPYALGQALVTTAAQTSTGRGVDDLMVNTPRHDAVLLDPFAIVARETDAAQVDRPALRDGEKKFDDGEFGAVSWYLMLAERLPLSDALAAVDGWHGDRYVAFERNKQSCVRATFAGAGKTAATTMYTALVRWQQAVRGYPASSSIHGARVTFETCDPGTKSRGGAGHATEALGFAASRAYLSLEMVKLGAPTNAARCFGSKALATFTLAQLNNRSYVQRPEVQARLAQLGAECRR